LAGEILVWFKRLFDALTGLSLQMTDALVFWGDAGVPLRRHQLSLFCILRSEVLRGIWTERCRAVHDQDPAAFTVTAVKAVIVFRVVRHLQTLREILPIGEADLDRLCQHTITRLKAAAVVT
jgi:hypothetical protein